MRPTCPILCAQCPCVFVARLAPIGNTVILGIEKGYIDTRVGLSLPYLTSYFKQYAHSARTIVGSGVAVTSGVGAASGVGVGVSSITGSGVGVAST